jgi:hypothetical protein
MRPQALFISEQTLKERTVISDNIDGKFLLQVILIAQEEKMLPALGSAFYNRLVAGIYAGSLTTEETDLLNDYITPAMVWYVMAELPMAIGVKFYNRNVMRKSGENSDNLSMNEMREVMDYYNNKAEFQKKRLINYLKANAVENGLFSEYLQASDSVDDITPETGGYTCPFVLDDPSETNEQTYDYE